MLTNWKLHPCENPSCKNRSWRSRFRTSPGIWLDGQWCCKLDCFEDAVEKMLAELSAAGGRREERRHRLPLGLLMLSEGWITEESLKAALKAHRSADGGRIGEWFLRMGTATEHQITTALGMQWARPVFSLEGTSSFLHCGGLIPFPLLESSLMVPVHYVPQSKQLFVAFAVEIDYSVLYGVEQILNCHTEPCIAKESSVKWALDRIRQQFRPTEIVFDSIRDPKEMARVAASYTAKLHAEQVRLARCGQFLWVQFRSPGQTTNLLFALVPERDSRPNSTPAAS